MENIAILTDSAADLTQDIIERYNIKVAPFRIIYKDAEYFDNVTIKPEEVYANLDNEIPTTSLPSVEYIENLINEIENEGYTHLIVLDISSHLSGTLNSMRLILDNHPNLTSFVYDTKTLTMGQGALVIETAKMIEDGKSFNDIAVALPLLRKKINVYFTLDTLEYLKRGGRIGKVAGTIGEVLKLKPIIKVSEEGIYETYAKARGRKQSIKKLHEILDSYLAEGKCNVWIIDGHAKEDGDDMYNSIKDLPMVNYAGRQILTPSLGVHTGPGLVGFVIQEV